MLLRKFRSSKKDIALFLLIFCLMAVFFIFARNGQKNSDFLSEGSLSKTKISASIYPLYDIIKNIVGDRADVRLIISDQVDPREFIPTPRDKENAFNSDIIFGIGLGIDDWVLNLEVEDSQTYLISEFLPVKDFPNKSIVGKDGKEVKALLSSPYVWLSLKNAESIVQKVARIVGQFDPINKEFYLNNAYDYNFKLDELYKRYFSDIERLKKEKFFVFGNFWGYLFDEFGLSDYYIINSNNADHLAGNFLDDFSLILEKKKVDKIFIDASSSEKSFETFKQKLFNYYIGTIDPFGINFKKSYLETMEQNLGEILRVLSS